MKITLKDGSVKEYEHSMSVIDIAKDLSEGLARVATSGRVNGELEDLRTVVDSDSEEEILTFDNEEGKGAFFHTTSHIMAQAIKRLYPETKLAIGPSIENGFYYDPEEGVTKHPDYYAGLYYIQEPSAMVPASRLPIEEGDRVLDLCAAPGGKTLLLAEEMQGTGRLVSCDAAENRVRLIRTAVERMGFAHVEPRVSDGTKPDADLPMADRILVDAPCSGLGILAKKPDIRYKTLDKARHDELLATQSAILDTAAAHLKPGGRLVYSTCTIDPSENEEQVRAFVGRHPEFRVVTPDVRFPAGMTVGDWGALSVPTRTGMDGFFLCAMQKVP